MTAVCCKFEVTSIYERRNPRYKHSARAQATLKEISFRGVPSEWELDTDASGEFTVVIENLALADLFHVGTVYEATMLLALVTPRVVKDGRA